MRLLAFVAFMAVGLVLAVRNRFAALLMYVWFALFRPQEWLYLDITRFRLSFVLGGLLVVPALFSGIWPTISHPLTVGTIAMLLSALVAQVTTPIPGNGWVWLDQFARLTVVACLAVSLLTTRTRIILFVAVAATSLGLHSAKAGMAFLLGGGAYFLEGIGGAYTDNNAYAIVGAMVMPLMIATAQNLRFGYPFENWVRRGFLLGVPLSALMIVGTRSRSGFLAMAAVVLFYIVLQRNRVRTVVAAAAILGVGYTFIPVSEDYVERLETITTFREIGEASALGRLHFWEVAFVMVSDNPLGVGPYNYDWAYDEYDFSRGLHGTGRSVHSSHLQVLTEMGYLGFVVWLGLFGYAFAIGFRLRRLSTYPGLLSEDDRRFYFTMSNAMLISMLAFVVGGTFISMALNDLTWYSFAVLAALDRLAARTATVAAAPQAVRYQAQPRPEQRLMAR